MDTLLTEIMLFYGNSGQDLNIHEHAAVVVRISRRSDHYGRLFHRFEDGIQQIGCRPNSLQMRVAKATVVIHHHGDELLVPLQQKLNRRTTVLGCDNGFAEVGNTKSLVIHGLQSHSWSDPCLECWAIP